MLRQSDIRQAALLMIRQRGPNAAVDATRRILALRMDSESDTADIWRLIANEITRIRTEERQVYGASLALFTAEANAQKAS